MSRKRKLYDQFLTLFQNSDVDNAAEIIQKHPELAQHAEYTAHPLLSEFVDSNKGHCYKAKQLQIADLLIPESVRLFRKAVITGRADDVRQQLSGTPPLVFAEFTAGRGIAQAIHHWTSLDVAELLVAAGAGLSATTTCGETPLAMQIRFGTMDGIRYLLENGAVPDDGPYHMPSKTMVEIIELLLIHNWDIQTCPFLHDANHGHGQRIRVWLKFGANPNMATASGTTALHMFAMKGSGRETIRALVDAGADIHRRDKHGRTPLDLAKRASQTAAAKELQRLGAED